MRLHLHQPPKILALDTSTDACSIALSYNNKILEYFEIAPQKHATLILPMIEKSLSEADLTLSELDLLAFGAGPGSFTGVRLAASIVQGLAFGANLKVLPISTLEALAVAAYSELGATHILAALDARMQEIYFGAYVFDSLGNKQRVIDDKLCKFTDIKSFANISANNWIAVGSAWDIYGESFLSEEFPERNITIHQGYHPRARYIAKMGQLAYANNIYYSYQQALPVYLRDKVVT